MGFLNGMDSLVQHEHRLKKGFLFSRVRATYLLLFYDRTARQTGSLGMLAPWSTNVYGADALHGKQEALLLPLPFSLKKSSHHR